MNQKATDKTYMECIRMLNGIEKSLERYPPRRERHWAVAETAGKYGEPNTEPRTLNT